MMLAMNHTGRRPDPCGFEDPEDLLGMDFDDKTVIIEKRCLNRSFLKMEIETMKKTGRRKKWKLLIIFIWILFMAAVSIGSFFLQRDSVYKKAKTELVDQAEIISGQFTSLVDTNYYTRAALYDRMFSEVKSLSFALESYGNIREAKGLLEDIVSTTEMKNLWIYDRDGNIVFGSGDAPKCPIEPDYIPAFLDAREYKSEEYIFDKDDRYLITTRLLDKDKNSLLWGVKDRWLVYVKDIFTDAQKDVVRFFDWDQVLQSISIGSRNGAVLAVSLIDGTVLSSSDPDARTKPVEDLRIKKVGKKEVLSVDQLLEEFPQMGEVKEIEVDSVCYYATRMDIDFDLFLVMFPVQTIENEVMNETVFLILPVLLITGIGIFYVFCLAAWQSEQSQNPADNKGRSPVLMIGKLRIYTVLAVLLVFALSLYLETHIVYSRMFQYTSTTAEDVMKKKSDSDKELEDLHKWVNSGNLEKTRIARCILLHADQGNVDRKYVSDLADSLNVSSVYLFDNRGKVLVTNAPYDGFIIDEESPFHALLEGTESVILQPEQEDASGRVQQRTGATMIDESNRVAGAVVIAADILPSLSDDLSFATVFQRVFLKDTTVVMAVDSENKKIRYFAQVNGALLVSDQLSYDYTEAEITALGVDESLVRDYYNGEMFALDNRYFASVRRYDNVFLMVLRPLVFIDAGSFLSVIFVTVATLLFFILLIIGAGRFKMIPVEASGAADDLESENQEGNQSAPDGNKGKDDEITLLESLTNRNKPYFEERWPADGKKWSARTSMEKFPVIVKLICVITLVVLFLYIFIEGENAIFYYSLTGYWSSGINLYSVTSCIIEIIILVLLKEIIHKVFYLIARVAQRKGESICHLLDSFTGYILFISGIFVILGTLGVNLAAMSLTAGVAGVIFGIGCQNIVADILAGIIMTFEGVACAGDFVSYNGKYALIQSVGVRTTKLKWFSEITFVRNNEFKNYISMPSDAIGRVVVTLGIDLKESLTRVESIIEKDLPLIHRNLCEAIGEEIRCPTYRGVQSIEDNGIKLSFAVSCKGMHFGWMRRLMSRELLLMCERNGIRLEMPQIVVHESADDSEKR